MQEAESADIPTWLTVAVAVATILAAYFAARSARHAHKQAIAAQDAVAEAQKQGALNKAQLVELRRQSDISLHTHRLDIYKALLEYRFEIKAKASSFSREKLWAYYAQARLAEFYFDPEISTALNSAIDQGLQLQTLSDRIKDPQGADRDEITKWRKESSDLYRVLDDTLDTLDTLDADLRRALRLLPPRI